MVNIALVCGAVAPIAGGLSVAPNNAAFNYTDYNTIVVNSTSATFKRSILDTQELAWVNPGARVRFQTTATVLQVFLTYTEQVARTDIYNGQAILMVNGVPYSKFGLPTQGGYQVSAQIDKVVFFPSNASRLIEVVMPYGTSLVFNGVIVNAGATVTAPIARVATLYAAMGDSITQGLRDNTDVSNTWAYLVAIADNYQIVNMGYGGRTLFPSDGTNLGQITANLYSYMIGYNDFAAQEALVTFQTNYGTFLTNFRALQPTAKLYCITPPPTRTVLAIDIEQYRQAIRNALITAGNVKNILVEGGSLWPNNVTYSADGIHPNNAGSASAAAILAPILVP